MIESVGTGTARSMAAEMAGKAVYYYRERADYTICLLKAYGQETAVEIPGEIQGKPVTEIGAYCFAAGRKLPAEEVKAAVAEPDGEPGNVSYLPGPEGAAMEGWLHELSGSYIEAVTLPDTVKKLDTCAFYHCTNLAVLSVPGGLEACGSDAFLNCGSLHRLIYRSRTKERGGLKTLLSQISWDVEVSFEPEPGRPEAVVYYPEYTEGYDEIGPAHMFEIYINGEGYRARQSFREDRIYFAGYDAVFSRACVEESPATLSRMAWDRLAFPMELSSGYREAYETYIRTHQQAVSELILTDQQLSDERRKQLLETLIRTHCFDRSTVDGLIRQASGASLAELAASLIMWKNRYCREEKKNRYAFDV